jgi:hypothetical protein
MAAADSAIAFPAFLEGALEALAREAPGEYARLADAAGGAGIRLRVDGPALVLRFRAGGHALEPGRAPAAVDVRTDRATIAALLGETLPLLEALASDRLRIDGDIRAVLRFEGSLAVFAEAVSRAPSFPALLAAYHGA